MIGQVKLLNSLEKLVGNFPKFLILVGEKGSGKKTICKEICRKLSLQIVTSDIKINTIRDTIELARTQTDPIMYLIPDADNMSVGAKNCLLKVLEEPPHNAYFIMTLRNINNTLPTIISRAVSFELDNYSKEELINYRTYKGYNDKFDDIVKYICNSTGDVDELFKYDVKEFYQFVTCVIENIHIPKNGNAFKITTKIKNKEDDKGFEFALILNTLRQLFIRKAKDLKDKKFLLCSIICSNYLGKLRNTSANKQALCDMWIMDIRRVLCS